MTSTVRRFAGVLAFSLLAPHASATQGLPTRVVALSGEPAASGPGISFFGSDYAGLLNAAINERGDVMFRSLTTRSFEGRQVVGVWIDPVGAAPVRSSGLADGPAAPGTTPGTRFLGTSTPLLDDQGDLFAPTFVGSDDPRLRSQSGIWGVSEGVITPIAPPGATLPGVGFPVVAAGGRFAMAGDGFYAFTADTELNSAWRRTESGPELIAVEGESVLEIGPGATLGRIDSLHVNGLSETIIEANVFDGARGRAALFRVEASGDRTLLALDGEGGAAVSGAPAGSTFDGLLDPRTNDRGSVTVTSGYRTPDGGQGTGIWLFPRGEADPTPIAVSGQRNPTDDGVIVSVNAFASNYGFNNNDVAGFRGRVLPDGESNSLWAAWVGGPSGIEQIALEGQPAPGLGPEIEFAQFGSPIVNDNDIAILTARVRGPGITDVRTSGAYAWLGPDRGLIPLLLPGQDFRVGPGDIRQVAEFGGILRSSTQPSAFNNRNELAVTITFEDGSSGVFVITVPEPSTTASLLAATSLAGLASRRRARLFAA